jgi:DHA2 family multidrug resistance protein-like MFS transporter
VTKHRHIPHDGLEGPRRYLAIATISLGTIMTAMDSSLVNIALPTITSEFKITAASSVLIVNASQIAMLVFLLPLAALGARIGYRRVYLVGAVVFFTGALLASLSHSLTALVAARALQGLGGAGCVGVQHALVRAVYPARLLGRGMGINSMFVASSSTVGPTVAGAVLAVASWPFLFVINLPIGAIAVVLGYFVLPWNERAKERFDAKAAAMTALTLGLFVLALDSFSHGGNPTIAAVELVIAAVVAVVLVKNQWDHPTPFLPFDLFANRIMPLSLLAGQCGFIAQLLTFVTLPFVLHNAGFSQVQIGIAMTPWPLVIAVTAPIAGILCDRYPPSLIGSVGLVLSTAGLLMLALLPDGFTLGDVVWRMALAGLGYGMFSPPNSRQIMHAAPKHRSGIVSGMIGSNRLAGQSIGAALAALVLTVVPNRAGLVALALAAIMTLIGAGISLMRAPAQIEARKG